MFLTAFLSAFSQPENMKEVFDDAEYFFLNEEYNEALVNYLKIYRRGNQNNANISYRIGVCYLNSVDKEKSIDYLETAVKQVSPNYKEGSLKEENAPIDAYLWLGNAYRIKNDLEKAITSYNKYLSLIKGESTKKDENVSFTKKQIECCQTAFEMEKNPISVAITVLDPPINNSSANFDAVVNSDETVMAYVNKLRFYDAVYVSRKVNDKWAVPENITPQIQSDGNQYTTCISANGNVIYFTKEDNYDSDIYSSKYNGKTWEKATPLNGNINTKYWESHASISFDGKTLYFSSNRRGGLGGQDIYVSQLTPAGDWGPAVNLGSKINTIFEDDYPFISEDGKTLYFSSQGHKNMGGFDIFYSTKQADGSWSEPVNIGYPINTTDDDIFYCPVKDGIYAYQSKFIKNGQGDLDIIRYELFSSKNPMKYIVNGNIGTIIPDVSNLVIVAVNKNNSDSIKVVLDKTTKGFSFKAPAGTYELIFIGKEVKKSKTFIIPADQKEQKVKINPELALLPKESFDLLTYVESFYKNKYTFL